MFLSKSVLLCFIVIILHCFESRLASIFRSEMPHHEHMRCIREWLRYDIHIGDEYAAWNSQNALHYSVIELTNYGNCLGIVSEDSNETIPLKCPGKEKSTCYNVSSQFDSVQKVERVCTRPLGDHYGIITPKNLSIILYHCRMYFMANVENMTPKRV